MGLDIVAYSKVVDFGPLDEETSTGEDMVRVDDAGFGRHAPLIPGHAYGKGDDSKEFHFRAGSYGGYNEWREWLCQIAHGVTPDTIWHNSDKYKDLAFFELIEFSDCDGVIGSVAAKKLLADFEDYEAKVNAAMETPRPDYVWFKDRYADWRKAFRLAADDGVLLFC